MNYSENFYIQLFQQQNEIKSEQIQIDKRNFPIYDAPLNHVCVWSSNLTFLPEFAWLQCSVVYSKVYFTTLSWYVFCWLTFCLLLYWLVIF